ncbi:uncharacterized protein LOC107274608 [Cephus cinctus]|uniref:Uncharacterized protein LOC107274608 n=1 Tax=Cephus cinctus TaxID=211228 RepID=A0AAJ7CGC7_CEPCN|nr:uncharacterized protein LOC107274608 [Cephus cinctus]
MKYQCSFHKLFLFLLGIWTTKISCESCSILINGGLAEPQPLIMWPGIDSTWAYPNKTGTKSIILESGDSLRLICLNSNFDIEELVNYSDTTVTCLHDTTVYFNEAKYEEVFENIACTSYPTETARKTSKTCPSGELCEIGFLTDDNIFHRTIEICHNETLAHTIVAKSKILAVVDAAQTSFPRPSFKKGNFYPQISMARIYTRVNQRATLATIVDSADLALKYIPNSGNYYLARGHLVAKTDMIYGIQQRSTFFYINSVPMWQNINAGNWATLEANVRNYATDNDVDLDIWSGSIDVLTLPDISGAEKEIWLYIDDNNNHGVPVPKILFKVAYDSISQTGTVFLIANNPFLESMTSEYSVCTDVSSQIDYMTWDRTRSDRGLSYCCEIDDFRKAFPDLDKFTTRGLLL